VVLRSVFEEQILAEQLAVHRFMDSHIDNDAEARSFLPESGTFPIGTELAVAHLARVRAAVEVPVVASLNGVTPGGWTHIAEQMESSGADAIELNLYDLATGFDETSTDIENRQCDVVASVVTAVDIPVTVKLSPFYTALPPSPCSTAGSACPSPPPVACTPLAMPPRRCSAAPPSFRSWPPSSSAAPGTWPACAATWRPGSTRWGTRASTRPAG
jgi:hypothetical protein